MKEEMIEITKEEYDHLKDRAMLSDMHIGDIVNRKRWTHI